MNRHEPPHVAQAPETRPPAEPETHVASVFKSNRSQAIRIPKAIAFSDSVKKVTIRKVDGGLLIKPVVQTSWAEYFSRSSQLTEEDAKDWLEAVSRDGPPDAIPSFDD